MLEDLEPIPISDFNGLWARGKDESVPIDHFIKADNIQYVPEGFTTRDGTTLDFEVASVLREHKYKIEGQVTRKLILISGGFLYDTLNMGIPILFIPTMIDFSVSIYGQRCFISPHDRNHGLPGQLVHIYDGVGVARPAAGLGPKGFTLNVVQSQLSGNIEAGDHLFAVVFETNSGYLTRPGPEVFAKHSASGTFGVDISNIPLGPNYVVARHILASKRIPATWNGNQKELEMFFVENASILNNLETEILNVNFYDADLVRSADYLVDQLEQIPACLGMATYRGMQLYWNENDQHNIIRVSKPFEPESIDSAEGYIEVKDEVAGGIQACVEIRQNLNIHKKTRSYVTQSTGDPPVNWPYSDIDKGVGTTVYGISKILDITGATTDIYALVDRAGIRLFTGTFGIKLTDKIDDLWIKRVNKAYLNTCQLLVDPTNSRLYCSIPLDGANSPNAILYGDFQNGLDSSKVKWAIWTFPYSPTSISFDVDANNIPYLTLASLNDNIYRFVPGGTSDNNIVIPWVARTAFAGGRGGTVKQWGGIRLSASGNGFLNMKLHSRNYGKTLILQPLELSETVDDYDERYTDFQSVLCSLELNMDSIGEKATITEILFFWAYLYN